MLQVIGDQVYLGTVAVMLGVLVGILLFVPFVAISYRRRGRVTLARTALWLAALVYFWAIWTYTLLPLPDPDAIECVATMTDPAELIRDLRRAASAPGNPLRHPAFLQIAFNILLFVPLGVFLRVIGGRGVVTALGVGFAVSLLIETTQLTGVWGIYPCAYRYFDVGDLITNTTGAVLGAVLALAVPESLRGMRVLPGADRPRPVTRRRRVIAMLCDLIGYAIVALGVSVTVQLWLQYVVRDRAAVIDGTLAQSISTAAAAGIWLLVILSTGRSVGDIAVQLRYTGSRLPEPLARLLRWAGGIGGIATVQLAGEPFTPVGVLLVLIAGITALTTTRGRGLPGLLSGQQLTDARIPATR